jgi:hypothetical protein
MATNLIAYRGRNDDGSETTATWKAAQNTPWVQAFNTNFRVRFLHQNDTAQILNLDIQLEYSLNGGTYTSVTATSLVVRSSASANLADAANLTTQLTGGTGTYVGATGFDEVNGICGGTAMDVTATGHFETEFCVQLRSADVSPGSTVTLRTINSDAGTAWGTYTVVATLTAPALQSVKKRDFIVKPPLGARRDYGHPLSRGCTGHWIMNERAGTTLYDISGLGRAMTLLNAPAWTVSSGGPAVDFDGTNNGATVASGAVNLDTGTFILWMESDATPAESTPRYLFDSDSARHACFMQGSGGLNTIQMYNDGRSNDFPVAWDAGAAVCIAAVYNKTGNVQQLYLNGVPLTGQNAAGVWGATALGALFYVGQRFNAIERADARLYQVRIYNRALTTDEIAWLYVEPYADMVMRPRIIIGRGAVVAPTFVPFPFRGAGGFDNMMGGLR